MIKITKLEQLLILLSDASFYELRNGLHSSHATRADFIMTRAFYNAFALPSLYLLLMILLASMDFGTGPLLQMFKLMVGLTGITILMLAVPAAKELLSLKRNKPLLQYCVKTICHHLKRNHPVVLEAEQAVEGLGVIFPPMPNHLR
jgi:chromate transport protein ChrA